MERVDNSLMKLRHLREEHEQRYKFAAKYAKGNVLDCACGIGYAAKFFLQNDFVTSYLGMDVNSESLAYANSQSIPNATFREGSIVSLDIDSDSIDTFVSLETLEHLECPETALQEISRVLKYDGVFICSVPTEIYENKCSELYGPNPYHVQAFSQQKIADLLASKFNFVSLAVASQRLVTTIHAVDASFELDASLLDDNETDRLDGSYIAICSNQKLSAISAAIYSGMSRVEYDREVVLPLRSNLNAAEELASVRWELLLKTEKINQDYKDAIESYRREVEACRVLIKDTEDLAQKRWDMLIEAEKKMSARYSKMPLVKNISKITAKLFDQKNTRK